MPSVCCLSPSAPQGTRLCTGGWEGVRVSLQRTQPPQSSRRPAHSTQSPPKGEVAGGGGDCHWTKQDSGRDGPVLWDKEAEGQMMGMNRTWQPRYGDMERPV